MVGCVPMRYKKGTEVLLSFKSMQNICRVFKIPRLFTDVMLHRQAHAMDKYGWV